MDVISRDADWTNHIPFLTRILRRLDPKVGVELGVNCGISLTLFSFITPECDWIGIDAWQNQWHWTDMEEREATARQLTAGRRIVLVKDDFHSAVEKLGQVFDVVHIDGNHDYLSIHKDFTLAASYIKPGGVILMHDICFEAVDVPWYWMTLKKLGYRTEESKSQCGLGAVFF